MKLARLLVLSLCVLMSFSLFASHGWSTYHWSRSCATCEASIRVYSSLTYTNTDWATHLNRAIFGDASNPNTANRRGWNDSAVLALSISAGATDSTTRANCPAVSGAVRVCNYPYGSTGWLGLAQLSTSGGHISWGTAKMNDSYFASGYPNTEKRHVMCQEVGHDFGLGHTSEDGSSQNTCMDYYQNTSSTDWTSTGPNQHDFDQLMTQHHYGSALPPASYSLLGFTSAVADGDMRLTEPWQWGTPIDFDREGRAIAFRLELDAKNAIYTYVRWAGPNDKVRPERSHEME